MAAILWGILWIVKVMEGLAIVDKYSAQNGWPYLEQTLEIQPVVLTEFFTLDYCGRRQFRRVLSFSIDNLRD